ncbi:site-specific integrase [Nocardioidaceae bacterium SCSIO 66511]|nr:site-specific integrase [Nocardioidaceae bacterium SCSIO 66511]
MESDLSRGTWRNEALARALFEDYATDYLEESPDIGERWAETCHRNMRLHMGDLLDMTLAEITPAIVRAWYRKALAGKGGRRSIQQSYAFLHAVMNAAVRDDAIERNPCTIKGATADMADERPIATAREVAQLIETITPRYRAAVALAAWCGIRRGEVCALRVEDVDLEAGTVWVRRNRVELLESQRAYDKDPKTRAGRRPVTIPPHVLPVVREHAQDWAGEEYFFVGRDGSRMRGNAVYQAHVRARKKLGLDLAFHDLRHTGQSLAAAAGANLADLKLRLGHSSSAAANRYLHAVEGRDSVIAAALSDLASARPDDRPAETDGAEDSGDELREGCTDDELPS